MEIIKRSVSELLDEIARASIRCTDEVVRLKVRPQHDGTEMLLIPEIIFNRLERAVKELLETGEY